MPEEQVITPPDLEDPAAAERARMTAELERSTRNNDALMEALRTRPAGPPPQGPPPVDKKALETQFFNQPLETSAAIALHAASAAVANQPGLDTLAEVAKKEVRSSDPEVWDKYAAEIEAAVRSSVPPQFQVNITVWRNAFNFVKGQHMDEIIKMKGQTPPAETSRRGGGPALPQTRAPQEPSKAPLTPEQAKVAREMRLTEDQYRHGLELTEKQHGKDKSPWDDVITIDSASKRREDARRRKSA